MTQTYLERFEEVELEVDDACPICADGKDICRTAIEGLAGACDCDAEWLAQMIHERHVACQPSTKEIEELLAELMERER